MKTKHLFYLPIVLVALVLPNIGRDFLKKSEAEPDDIVYSDDLVKDFNKPDVKYDANLAPKRAAASATSISIHYHNDDAACHERELWIWCPGVVGQAFAPTSISSDHKDMVVSFSFSGEYKDFNKKKSLSFIVKKVGTWLGQSDNILIEYSEYEPDSNGKVEIWTLPGEGNAVEVYKTEAETKMDRFVYASFTGWKKSGGKEVEDWKTIKVIATAVPQSYRLYALTSNYMSKGSMATQDDLKQYLIASGSNPTCKDVTYNSAPCKEFNIVLNFTAKVNVQYYLEGVFPKYSSYTKSKYVSSTELYETPRFKTYYEYTGNDLGVTYSSSGTTFKVWAPTAARVRVLIYESGTPSDYTDEEKGIIGNDNYSGYNMVFQPGGIWAVTITGKNLLNYYYNYYVVNSLGVNEANDPYAKACGVNGTRGMITNFDYTNPTGWSNIPTRWDGVEGYDIKAPNELSIYETHIRDLTMDETWTGESMPGTYSAFVESGTTYTKDETTVTTGFDHLTELGIKAVHLEPVFDSDNLEGPDERSYNWGYNPLNYNCVDGAYATDPFNGTARIIEFKKLVKAFAENGNHTRVIMDVVYNHVASAPGSCFNKLMPKYYFRIEPTSQTYYDGSGCGNEIKTEAPMMSKYIVDSLCWWAKEYKIKGFRFDLMGCIDFETMKKAAKALYAIDPDIYLYGEGWTSGGCNMDNGEGGKYAGNWGSDTWTVYNKLQKEGDMCYIGCFNDGARNALRGKNDLDTWGFIGQGSDHVGQKSLAVADMLIGYHSQINDDGSYQNVGKDPNQCVNYASCHDNYTLFDQLTYTIGGDGKNDYPGIPCAGVIACECAVLASNGVAFLNGGEELFRTKVVTDEDYESGLAKPGDTHMINGTRVSHNSYNLSDKTNSYKWDRKISINGVKTLDYVRELEKAVAIRNELKKYSKGDLVLNNPYTMGSPLNVWGQSSGSTVIALQNNEFFFFLAGANNDEISFDAINTFNKQVFCSNPKPGGYEAKAASIKLGWYTCVMLTKADEEE